LREEVGDRLSLKYHDYVGQAGNKAWKRVRMEKGLAQQSIRRGQLLSVGNRPLNVRDVCLEVFMSKGEEVEEDVSCDSTFMLQVMDEVGKAIREKYHWVAPNEIIYLGMDNAGGHGTDVATQQYSSDLWDKYNIQIVWQIPRSPETNKLDLGVWCCMQSGVEKEHTFKVYDAGALSRSVVKAWHERLKADTLERVYKRLVKVLKLIRLDNGNNNMVEARRGKLMSDPLTLTMEEEEEEIGDDNADEESDLIETNDE